eukprot:5957363-Amphidinium_carterae.4
MWWTGSSKDKQFAMSMLAAAHPIMATTVAGQRVATIEGVCRKPPGMLLIQYGYDSALRQEE